MCGPRLVIRFGGHRTPAAQKRAIVAVAHTLSVIIWHVLATGKTYTDLGPAGTARWPKVGWRAPAATVPGLPAEVGGWNRR